VAVPQGTHKYNLSVWAKSIGNAGSVSVAFNKALLKLIAVTDSTWTLYQSTLTFTGNPSDTLTIDLDAGTTYGAAKSYFDLCKFEVLD
jgi:hypothetical protein